MGDLYAECLVKKEKTGKDSMIKYGLIVLLVLAIAAGLFIHPVILLPAAVLGIVCWVFIPQTDLEYEYLFVNGELDIDKVIAKSKRKKVMTVDFSDVDLGAPEKSHRMDYYNGNTRLKVLDYSSGNEKNERFVLIAKNENENVKLLIEPDEKMKNFMKNSAPGRIFLD